MGVGAHPIASCVPRSAVELTSAPPLSHTRSLFQRAMATAAAPLAEQASASTPGLAPATGADLRAASINIGMPTESSFARKRNAKLGQVADDLNAMLSVAHVVGINELHPAHHAAIDGMLSGGQTAFLGWRNGLAIAWRAGGVIMYKSR